MDIAPTDGVFKSQGWGDWTLYEPTSIETFGDGHWVVNGDIAPGRWQSSGGDTCYWQRSSGFSGELGSILANSNVTGPTVVDIAPTDAGFKSSGCGDWTRVG